MSTPAPSTPSAAPPTPPASTTPHFSHSDLAMLAVVVIWGTNYTVVKETMDAIPALAFMSLRFALATLAMGVLMLWLEGWKPLPRATFLRLTALGLIGNTLYQLCFMVGMSHTTAANSGMLGALSPVLVPLLAGVLGLDKITRSILLALALAVPGMLLVVSSRGPNMSAETRLGDLLILAGICCWATYTVGLRTLSTELSPLRITAMTMLTGAPGAVLAGLPAVLRLEPSSIAPGAWAGLIYSALIPLVLAYFIWSRSVQQVGSSRTALYTTGMPVVAALTAWVVRGERPTPVQAVGVTLILAGQLISRRR